MHVCMCARACVCVCVCLNEKKNSCNTTNIYFFIFVNSTLSIRRDV